MIPVMVISARPYGLWRDWVLNRVAGRTKFSRIIADITAFLVFHIPLYVASLIVAGGSRSEIATAVVGAVAAMLVMGRSFGIYLDSVRKWAGIS